MNYKLSDTGFLFYSNSKLYMLYIYLYVIANMKIKTKKKTLLILKGFNQSELRVCK